MLYMSLPTCPRKPSCFDRDIGNPYAPSCVGGGLHEPVAIEKEAVADSASTSKEASCLYSPTAQKRSSRKLVGGVRPYRRILNTIDSSSWGAQDRPVVGWSRLL